MHDCKDRRHKCSYINQAKQKRQIGQINRQKQSGILKNKYTRIHIFKYTHIHKWTYNRMMHLLRVCLYSLTYI